ncbi:hypothetical protein CEY04_09005 [Achromobacter sp. HZ28]|nr:hypothetical protein CEY05_19085 [Achromobacter sp. HZ34]OWT79156.1 hypothetical protein CEY04_09005 [Achromobacter sp. HZ28]
MGRLPLLVISAALVSPWILIVADPALAISDVTGWSRFADAIALIAIGVAALVGFDLPEWGVEAAMGIWLAVAPTVLGYRDIGSLAWISGIIAASLLLLAIGAAVVQVREGRWKRPY